MTNKVKATALIALAGAVALPLAACGGGSTAPTTSGSAGSAGSAASGGAGGTLYYLMDRSPEHFDPQRMYIGRDLSNTSRTVYRSLLQFPVTSNADEANKPVADLATDTGTSSEGGKVWKFTIKDGVKWEDGQDIKCEDFKYGVSRSFATDVITGGPNYILGYLDLPASGYNGPYKKTGQADFDKAITCEGKTITYKFKKAWPDFPLAVASLRSFDPFRADKDKGDQSNLVIFSNGPYKVDGTYKKGQGMTLVRNENYDAKTDGVRKALPDKIVFTEGVKSEIAAQRFIADSGNDQFAVADRRVPSAFYGQLAGDKVSGRTTNPESPYVDYVVPNQKRLTNPKVRQALAMATDRNGYITAAGGEKAGIPAVSIVNKSLVGYVDNPAFKDIPASGDPEKAKALLQEAGVSLPVKIKYTYNGGTPTTDKQAAALKAGWDKAGFETTLDPLTDTYYAVIQNPANTSDVMWGGWGADWPSMSTVIPALFDSRLNLTAKSSGQDYGLYQSDEANKAMDDAMNQADVNAQAAGLAKVDEILGKDVAYVPLAVQKFVWLHGSKVTGWIDNPATSMYPDLGSLGVTQ